MSTVEEIVAKINDDDWYVSDIHQTREIVNGGAVIYWRVALRQAGNFTSAYGGGQTMRNALIRAWQYAREHPPMTDHDWDRLANPPLGNAAERAVRRRARRTTND